MTFTPSCRNCMHGHYTAAYDFNANKFVRVIICEGWDMIDNLIEDFQDETVKDPICDEYEYVD